VFYKLWKKISPWENKNTWYKRAWAVFLTFSFVTLTRVWFRAGSNNSWEGLDQTHDVGDEFWSATVMLKQIFLNMNFSVAPQVLAGYWKVFVVFAIGMIIHWLPSTFKENYRTRFAGLPIWATTLVCFAAIFFMYQVMSSDSQPFIYFQF